MKREDYIAAAARLDPAPATPAAAPAGASVIPIANPFAAVEGMSYRVSCGPARRLLWVSDQSRTVLGAAPEQVVAAGAAAWREGVPDADRRANRVQLRRALRAREPFALAYRVRDAAGRLHWVAEVGRPVQNESGRLLAIEGVVTNLHDLRQSFEQHQAIHRGLRAVLEAADELGAAEDCDDLCRRAVELARERLGAERVSLFLEVGDGSQLVGTYGTDRAGATCAEHDHVVPRRDILGADPARGSAVDPWFAHLAPPVEWVDGHEVLCGDRPVWVCVTPVRSRHGLLGALCNDRALSLEPLDDGLQYLLAVYASLLGGLLERQQIHDALTQREGDYRDLFENSLNALALHEMVFDPDGQPADYRFLMVNTQFEALTGLHNVVGRLVSEVLPDNPASYVQAYGRVVQSGEPLRAEMRVPSLGRVYDVTAFRTRPRQFAAVFTETTDRYLAEQERRLNEARLDALVRLNQMTDATLAELAEFGLEEGVRLTGSAFGYLAFLNADESVLTMHAWSAEAMAECAVAEVQREYRVAETGLWGEPVRRRETVISNGPIAADPASKGVPAGHVAVHRHLGVPIFEGDRIVAVTGVANKPEPYDETDARQLKLLMTGLWLLLQRSRAQEALRAGAAAERTFQRKLRRLHDVTTTLSGAQGLQELCRRTVIEGRALLDCDTLGLWFGSRSRDHLLGTFTAAADGSVRDEHEVAVPVVDADFGSMLAHGLPSHLTAQAPLLGRRTPAGADPSSNLWQGSHIHGVLAADNRHSHQPFTPHDRELLALLASHVGHLCTLQWAQADLQRSEERYRLLFQHSPVGIVQLDQDGRCIDCNDEMARLTGASMAQLLGLDYLHHPDARGRQQIEDALAGRSSTFQGRLDCPASGHTLEIRTLAHPLYRQNGEQDGALLVVEDVSNEIELEERLQQASKMEAVGRLAGGVAHDFNNLLTTIMGYADLVLNRLPHDHPVCADIQAILRATDHANGLTRQLLAFSRRQVMQPRILDLNQVIDDLTRMVRPLLGEDIGLRLRLDPGLSRVKADAGQMEQVLMNLVVNARDAMPEGGRLTIETRNVDLDAEAASRTVDGPPGRYVLVAVTDTGVGMDEETRRRACEPFFTTKERGRGTGFGLATSYGIVRQSGGQIDIESEPGQGATFRVYLPATAQVAAGADAPVAERAGTGGAETILLVEDQPEVRGLARRVLATQGYLVLEAEDGQAALALLLATGAVPDLLLTDVVMPNMGGPELSRRLRDARPDLPVLFVSGYTDNAVARGPFDARTGFLQKPFSPNELLRRLRDLLDAG